MKRKKMAPSRIKYEQSHPVVSFRITKELNGRLQAIRKAENKSITDILKIGLGILEVKIREEKQIKEQAYHEGLEYGFKEVAKLYKVTYQCAVCRKTIEVTSSEEKRLFKNTCRKVDGAMVNVLTIPGSHSFRL